MLRTFLFLLFFGTAAAPHAAGPQRSCSGFSSGAPVTRAGVTWQFRVCADAYGRELQLRFHNQREAPVSLAYVALSREPRDCDSAGPDAFRGSEQLGPGEWTRWPYARHRLDPATRFSGRVWVCVETSSHAGSLATRGRSQ